MTAHATFDGVATLAVISATLVGCDHASAEGISVTSPSPVLALCRQLVARGYDPDLPLIAYRGSTLALRVRSIGEATRLRVGGHGIGFKTDPECGAAPPMRQPGRAAVKHRARRAA
jgi:hypothetical protein